ncbi:hypothetical protein [Burkholderia sp. Se-20378]|uniref:hypothetical protein n=1 Tax=Burkholderia sp. Se-20378 TaxID=2703899 RepID=UPI00197F9FB1|nr:hypothetical protein [Burkholderia sp. Se-20378]MBN3769481.1 hypothetical protein [Burkholderia sp. Se-20378]
MSMDFRDQPKKAMIEGDLACLDGAADGHFQSLGMAVSFVDNRLFQSGSRLLEGRVRQFCKKPSPRPVSAT